MELAALGIRAESGSVRKATDDLHDLSAAAHVAEGSVDRFSDEMDESGRHALTFGERIRKVEGSLAAVAKRTVFAAAGFLALTSASLGVAGLAGATDKYNTYLNTLRVVATEQSNVGDTLLDLQQIAARTRAPLEGLVSIYQRATMAGGELGASQGEILRFTENVGLALGQTGRAGNEARGALLQLSQALGSGIVRAEEFNSILEGAYPIAQAAARGLDGTGGSVARLRRMIADGQVTSDQFFRAILSQSDELEATFAQTVPTIAQGFQRAADSFTVFIGKLDESTGFSQAFTGALIGIANALDEAARWLDENQGLLQDIKNTIGGTIITVAALGVAYVAAFVAASIVTSGLTGVVIALVGAFRVLTLAIAATGIGALVVAAGFLVGRFLELTEATGSFANAWRLSLNLVLEVWDRMKLGGSALLAALSAAAGGVSLAFQEAFAFILEAYAALLANMLTTFDQFVRDTGNFLGQDWGSGVGQGLRRDAEAAAAAARAGANAQRDSVVASANASVDFAKQAIAPLASWQEINAEIERGRAAIKRLESETAGGGVAPKFDPDAAERANKYIDSLRKQREEIGLTGIALKRLEIARAAEEAERNKGYQAEIIRSEGEALINDLIKQQQKERDESFEREIDQMLRQSDAWYKYGEDRALMLDMMAVEERRRQDLIGMGLNLTEAEIDARARFTDAEKEVYEAVWRSNAALELRANILGSIKDPADQYLRTLKAVAAMVEAGDLDLVGARRILSETEHEKNRAKYEQVVPPKRGEPGFEPLGVGVAADVAEARKIRDDLYAFLASEEKIQMAAIEQVGLTDAARAGEMELELLQEMARRREEVEQATADKITEIRRAAMAVQLTEAAQGLGQLAQVIKDGVGEQSAIYKTVFAAQQAFAIASAIVNIQRAMSEALTLPFPANLGAMGMVAAEGANIIAAIQAVSGAFAEGGYTGPGGKYQAAGIVHAGEVVFSQADVARHGGWQNVDNMRRGMPAAANDNGRVQVQVGISVDDDGRLQAYVRQSEARAVAASVSISDARTRAALDGQREQSRRPAISARAGNAAR